MKEYAPCYANEWIPIELSDTSLSTIDATLAAVLYPVQYKNVEICAEVGLGLGPDYMYADTGWLIRGWMEFTANAYWRCGESERSTEKIW